LIEDQFFQQNEALQIEMRRNHGPNFRVPEWALTQMDENKIKLSVEIRRDIEALRSESKIQSITTGRKEEIDGPVLSALRKRLTDNQRNVLNTIWKYYIENKDWVPNSPSPDGERIVVVRY
jgi:hypothetical protein